MAKKQRYLTPEQIWELSQKIAQSRINKEMIAARNGYIGAVQQGMGSALAQTSAAQASANSEWEVSQLGAQLARDTARVTRDMMPGIGRIIGGATGSPQDGFNFMLQAGYPAIRETRTAARDAGLQARTQDETAKVQIEDMLRNALHQNQSQWVDYKNQTQPLQDAYQRTTAATPQDAMGDEGLVAWLQAMGQRGAEVADLNAQYDQFNQEQAQQAWETGFDATTDITTDAQQTQEDREEARRDAAAAKLEFSEDVLDYAYDLAGYRNAAPESEEDESRFGGLPSEGGQEPTTTSAETPYSYEQALAAIMRRNRKTMRELRRKYGIRPAWFAQTIREALTKAGFKPRQYGPTFGDPVSGVTLVTPAPR